MKIAMVSTYPPKGSKHTRLGGVAAYTKNLVASLLTHSNCSLIVFADQRPMTERMYTDEGAVIYRCWSKNVAYPFQIFRKIQNASIDTVHLQHETYLFGELGSAIAFPLLLALIRLLRKPTIVTLHGVLPLSKIDTSFLRSNSIKGHPEVMKIGWLLLVRLIALLSTSVIVHETGFKRVLTTQYRCPARKIHVIHHGIEERSQLIDSNAAKEKLGLDGKKTILFFGYIAGYKNIDLLIESMKFLKAFDCVTVVAGSPHPRLLGDRSYETRFLYMKKKAFAISKDKFMFRGFIPEEEIPLYYSAADLLVFPYTAVISSSGPLCLAISYRRPFLTTSNFEMIQNKELTFGMHPKELALKIMAFFENEKLRNEALEYIESLRVERSWKNVGNETIGLYRSILK